MTPPRPRPHAPMPPPPAPWPPRSVPLPPYPLLARCGSSRRWGGWRRRCGTCTRRWVTAAAWTSSSTAQVPYCTTLHGTTCCTTLLLPCFCLGITVAAPERALLMRFDDADGLAWFCPRPRRRRARPQAQQGHAPAADAGERGAPGAWGLPHASAFPRLRGAGWLAGWLRSIPPANRLRSWEPTASAHAHAETATSLR